MTETAKHTPGPWDVHEDDGYEEIQIVYGRIDSEGWPEWSIAECFGGLPDGEQEANARLIAAAPDLLELAKLVHDSFGGGASSHSQMQILGRLKLP